MLKKLFVVAAIAGVALIAVKGTRFMGYLRTEVNGAQSWLDDQVPVEKEISRLNGEVDRLEKDISKVKDNLAKELYTLEKQQKDIKLKQAKLDSEQKDLLARAETLNAAADEKQVSIGNEKFSKPAAQLRLSNDSKIWKLESDTLTQNIKSMRMTEENVSQLQQHRAELENQKGTLKVRLQKIAADYKALELQKMETKYKKDDTRLSKIQRDLEKLEDRLGVQKVRVNMDKPADKADAPAAETIDDIMKRLKTDSN